MAVLRGQYYQYKAIPLNFCFVVRVYSTSKIQMIDVDYNIQIVLSEAQILSRYTLVPYLPQNRVFCTTAVSQGGAHGFALTGDFLSGSVQTHGAVNRLKAFAPTYLRSKIHGYAGVTQAGLINPLVLGGYLAAQGTVVQAHADQG